MPESPTHREKRDENPDSAFRGRLPAGRQVRRTAAWVITMKPCIFPTFGRVHGLERYLEMQLVMNDALSPPHSMGPGAKHCGFAPTAPMPRRERRRILPARKNFSGLEARIAEDSCPPKGVAGPPSFLADKTWGRIARGKRRPRQVFLAGNGEGPQRDPP